MPYQPDQHMISHGKKIEYAEATGTPSYIKIFGNFDIDLPDGELSESEITNDDTPDNGKDHVPGMYDWGKASFKYKYTASQFTAMDAIYLLASSPTTRASATKLWKVTAADGGTWSFKGFITKHKMPLGTNDDTPEVEGEIRCRSKPVYTPPA